MHFLHTMGSGYTLLLSSSLENLKVWCTVKGVCMDLQGHTFSSDSRIKKSFFSDSVNGSAIQFYGTAFSFFGIFSVYLIHINWCFKFCQELPFWYSTKYKELDPKQWRKMTNIWLKVMRDLKKQCLYISCLKCHKPFNINNKEKKTRANLKQEWWAKCKSE